jgi:hypothetical protein
MTRNHPPTRQQGRTLRNLVIAGSVLLGSSVVAACTPHEVGVKHPCPDLSIRGAVALAKLGLTPDELKAQQHCR